MSDRPLPEVDQAEALHEAIGWLVGSIESERPGFVAEQARVAGDTPIGGVLAGWAQRLGQKGRLCRRCRRRLGESRFLARRHVCTRCLFDPSSSDEQERVEP